MKENTQLELGHGKGYQRGKYVVIRNVTREECSTHAVMALFLACIASDEADACMGTLYAGRAQDA